MTVKTVSPQELKAMLHDDGEIAVLDAREEGDFATSHLLLAASVPFSRMEALLAPRVPRTSARIVWMDAGEGFAERAAERSVALGYGDVSVLEGGVEAWRMAGYLVYTGVHVPSKAFAEVVEHEESTPWISATALQTRMAEDPTLVLLDSRSYDEYHANTIPGSVSCPGAELVYRIHEMVPSKETTVVVNCGGRTRSIIGAQSLINAGLENPVMSLRDGTMAWHLAGLEVATGREARAPDASAAGLQWAEAAASGVASRFAVPRIGADELDAWSVDDSRTLYVVDVRTAEEYEAGHIAQARLVPGGQLVQETDRHLGVWGSRVVLTDDDGIRATMTASWLIQMGWEAYVFVAPADYQRVSGPQQVTPLGWEQAQPEMMSPAALSAALESVHVPLVVDIESSEAYAQGHVPGAWFATRARLECAMADLPAAAELVLTSSDGVQARLAAAALAHAGKRARALEGGTAAWRKAGLPIEHGLTRTATPTNDTWRVPRNREPERRDAFMREYLSWETALVHVIAHDDDCRYRTF